MYFKGNLVLQVPFLPSKNVDVLSNDAKNKKNNAGGDIISYRCNIWIKYK